MQSLFCYIQYHFSSQIKHLKYYLHLCEFLCELVCKDLHSLQYQLFGQNCVNNFFELVPLLALVSSAPRSLLKFFVLILSFLPSVFIFACLSVYIFLCLSVYLSILLSVYTVFVVLSSF